MVTVRVLRAKRVLIVAICGALVGGCLGPLVDDDVTLGEAVLPPGTEVPLLDENPELAAQIAKNDGVGDLVRLVSAFVDGAPVKYWDFGLAPPVAIPIYVLADKATDGTLSPRPDHPPVIDSIPGDAGYSPFWLYFMVPVTEAYNGETLASFEAVQQAVALGLVETPVEQPIYGNCPVVASDVRLEMGDGSHAEPLAVYYRGQQAALFSVGQHTLKDADNNSVPIADVYVLRREGSEVLSESVRGVDMTNDGDTQDTNNIFAVAPTSDDYTPLWRPVEVVVPTDYKSIDSSQDQTVADFTHADDLFEDGDDLVPVSGNVVAFSPTSMLVNCPILDTTAAGTSQ